MATKQKIGKFCPKMPNFHAICVSTNLELHPMAPFFPESTLKALFTNDEIRVRQSIHFFRNLAFIIYTGKMQGLFTS